MTYGRVDDLPTGTPFPGGHGKFIQSAQMTFVYWDLAAGVLLPEHSHPHEQVVHTFAGRFELTIAGETQILEAGSVTVIPANAVHSGQSLTRCRIMDAFCPVREDYRAFGDP